MEITEKKPRYTDERVRMKRFIESGTPFAVMQYYECFKGNKTETHKRYELIYLNPSLRLAFKVLNQVETNFVKLNKDKIKLIIENKDGRVFDFNNFKQYQKDNAKGEE